MYLKYLCIFFLPGNTDYLLKNQFVCSLKKTKALIFNSHILFSSKIILNKIKPFKLQKEGC